VVLFAKNAPLTRPSQAVFITWVQASVNEIVGEKIPLENF
jgi:hypothetical protein